MSKETSSANGGHNDFNSTSTDGKEIFKISLFKNKKDAAPQLVNRSWQQLCDKFQNPQIRKAKDGLLFSPATFEPAYRSNKNVKELSFVVLDYDHKVEFDELCERLRRLGCSFIVHTTHSHLRKTESNPDGEARFRVVIPLTSPIPAKDFLKIWRWIVNKIGLPVDESKKGVASMFYAPAKATEDAPYNCFIESGTFFDWLNILLHISTATESERIAKYDKLNEFLSKLKNVRQTDANQWTACCPSHNDRMPSLSVTTGKDGKIVVHCQSDKGCTYKSIFSAVGMNSKQSESKLTTNEPLMPLSIVCVANALIKAIEYLWEPLIARAMITMMSGAEGIGKSWLTCALAAAISTGKGFPVIGKNGKLTFKPCEAGTVLILSAEDSLSQIIKPRLETLGADTKRIYVVDEPLTFDEKGLLKLRALLLELKPDLVIIDPIFAFTPAKVDINAANQSRAISKELAAMAEETNAAFLLVRHIGKAKGNGDSRAAGLGSIDWRAAVRSELIVGTNPENEAERVIAHDKCNYAPKGEAISYTIENTADGAQFRWLGRSNLTAAALLGKVKDDNEREEQTDIVEFLKVALTDDQGNPVERDQDEIKKEAEKQGITPKQLRNARIKLGIKFGSGIRREGLGKDQKTYWNLPEKTETTNAHPEENDSTNAHNIEKGHLWTNSDDKTSYHNSLPTNAQTKEKGHLCNENRHFKALVEVETTEDVAGVKLFDTSIEGNSQTNKPTTKDQIEKRCFVHTCRALLHGADICPSCDTNQNDIPF